jgi:HK97 family phage major capsid protein
VYTDMSRKFVLQAMNGSPVPTQPSGAEQFLRSDLARVLGVELDRVALNGNADDSGNQPTGILQNSNITVWPLGTNGAAPAFSDLLSLETGIGLTNADVGSLGYVTSPRLRSYFKTLPVASGITKAAWCSHPGPDGRPIEYLAGAPAFSTSNVPGNLTKGSGTALSAIIYGNWEDLVIAIWGNAVEILVDPFTFSTTGTVRLVARMNVDVQVRHAESFRVITDAAQPATPVS